MAKIKFLLMGYGKIWGHGPCPQIPMPMLQALYMNVTILLAVVL